MSGRAATLIVVPGHGVCRAECSRPDSASEDGSWIGGHPGEGAHYVAHIRAGIERAAVVPGGVLVFSGGRTWAQAGPRSEATSYRDVAIAAGGWGHPQVAAAALVEEYARDSFENLLCAILCCRAALGVWPEALEVVGWGFKQRRFHSHAAALGWPLDRFRYHPVNEPPDLAAAIEGEGRKLEATRADPMLRSAPFREQRQRRDPFARGRGYRGISPGIDAYLAALAGPATEPVPQPPWDEG